MNIKIVRFSFQSVFIVLVAILSFNTMCFCQWNNNSSINTLVCNATRDQQNVRIITDEKHGAILAWEDFRNTSSNVDIYIQRLNSQGLPMWANNGIAVCNDINNQTNQSVIGDGLGGAFIVWKDERNNQLGDVYAQHIDSNGVALWTANGVSVSTVPSGKREPKISLDTSGGIFVVWEDSISAGTLADIKVQRLNSNGVKLWQANGVDACTILNSQINPKIKTDAGNNIIVSWQDKRSNNDYDIYGQKIDATGNIVWPAGGIQICTATNTQSNPEMVLDNNGGAFITWVDKRSNIASDIYLQHISSSGTPLLAANGIVICNAINSQSALDITLDNIGNVLLVWKDGRANSSINNIYVQKINSSGVVQWATNGVILANSTRDQVNPSIISTPQNAGIIVWQESDGSGGWNASAAKINSNGAVAWHGFAGSAALNQTNPKICSDGNEGAIVAFQDARDTLTKFDIYAHRIDSAGVGLIAPFIFQPTNLSASYFNPNPFVSNTTLTSILTTSSIYQNISLDFYDHLGKLIFHKIYFNYESIQINNNDLPIGISFYKVLSNNKLVASGKLIRL